MPYPSWFVKYIIAATYTEAETLAAAQMALTALLAQNAAKTWW